MGPDRRDTGHDFGPDNFCRACFANLFAVKGPICEIRLDQKMRDQQDERDAIIQADE